MTNKQWWVGLTLFAALGACQKQPPAERPEPKVSTPVQAAPAEATGPSIYDLRLTLTDQDGKKLGLDAFAGRPVIISMFYASCPYACPLLINDIKQSLEAIEPGKRDQVQVLLVSLDPERDTPVALQKLARAHDVDTPNWRFTTAPESQVRQLAAVLGIKYKKLENGPINHSSVITLLDGKGRVQVRSENLGKRDPVLARELTAAAKRAAEG